MVLNLLLLSLDYPPNDGGISHMAGDITRALTSKGCLTRVVTFSANDNTGSTRPNADYWEISRHKGLRDLQLMYAVNQAGRDTRVLAIKWNPEATLAMLAGHVEFRYLSMVRN